MGYLFVVIAAIAAGGQFSLSKVYKRLVPSSDFSDLFYNFATGLFSVVIFAVICQGQVGFTAFSFWLAAGVAICNTIYTICGLKAVMYGKLAVFTAFLMLGGMVFPTVYGVIFLHEKMSGFKIAGVAILIFSMLFSLTEKTEEKKNTTIFYVLCLIAFVCNGFVSVFSKMHQIGAEALDTYQFSFWQSVVVTVAVGGILAGYALVNRKKENSIPIVREVLSGKSFGLILLVTVIMRAGSVLLLFAAKDVPASALYPFMTGLSILVTAIFGRIFFKEKISRINAVTLTADIVAVVLMIF